MNQPLILDVRGNSLDDGPGIRTVVFFKGCPLSCTWCHNPESKRPTAELAFDGSECIACDSCIGVCSANALSRKNDGFVDRMKCTQCFRCADVCPSGALSRVGKAMTIDEVMAAIGKDMPFYKNSGGGVTLSGGEPTLYMKYASELLRECKRKKIHTLIETCGFFDWNEFEEKIFPWTDMVYFDIKLMDSILHKKYCGVHNDKILKNFEKLVGIAKKRKISLLARTPLVPTITDTEENLSAIAKYLAGLGIKKSALLPYNPMWRQKSVKLGMCRNNTAQKDTWMPKDKIEKSKQIFIQSGIVV